MGLVTAFLAAQFLAFERTIAANGLSLVAHALPWIALAVLGYLDWQTTGGKARLIVAAVSVVAVYLQLTGKFPSFKAL